MEEKIKADLWFVGKKRNNKNGLWFVLFCRLRWVLLLPLSASVSFSLSFFLSFCLSFWFSSPSHYHSLSLALSLCLAVHELSCLHHDVCVFGLAVSVPLKVDTLTILALIKETPIHYKTIQNTQFYYK